MALADIIAEQRPARPGTPDALADLRVTFGDRLVTGEDVRRAHSHVTTYIPSQLPDARINSRIK